MEFGTAIKTCLNKYFVFSGRATRSEFWWFYLFTLLLGFAGGIVDGVLAGIGLVPLTTGIGIFGGLATLFTIIPSIAAATRRLHDTDRSGWWLGGYWVLFLLFFIVLGLAISQPQSSMGLAAGVLGLIIVIWAVALLVFYCLDSQPGENRYGVSEKYPHG